MLVSNEIPFFKMHGLGNDFVIIYKHDIAYDINLSDLAIKISDRRLGIGCDQFIVISIEPKLEMFIYNMDGSEANACGNGTRCVIKMLNEKIEKKEFQLNVKDRILDCKVTNKNTYSVNMGPASFKSDWMLNSDELWNLADSCTLDVREIMLVDMGNPHLVIIHNNLSLKEKEVLGEKLEKHSLFPNGVNVNFVNIKDRNIDLQVWERGAGFTLACGSGACASFAAARKMGFTDDEAIVNFKYGSLKLSYSNGNIIMNGPASLVYQGIYHYE